jgi:hypothetical protein
MAFPDLNIDLTELPVSTLYRLSPWFSNLESKPRCSKIKVPAEPQETKAQNPAGTDSRMSDNPNSIDSQPFNASGPPCTRKELVELSLGSMPPVQGDTEEERLEAAFERTVRAFIKVDEYFHRFDSPEQQAQELAKILSARPGMYQIADIIFP